MVRLLLIVHYNERRMPEERAELFMRASETMIQLDYLPDVEVQQLLKACVGKSWSDHYEMLQNLAFSMHRQGEAQGRELDESGLRDTFRDTGYVSAVDALINYTRTRGGLLEERLGMYRFIHLGFQEYLAARYLIKVVGGEGGVEAVVSFLEQGPILDSWWREPAMLIPGYCVADSNSSMARKYLRRLAGIEQASTLLPDAQLACAEVAATAALELRGLDDSLRTELADQLAALCRRQDLMTVAQPIRRAAAGVALARLGDPRPEVLSVDAMRLCFVPAGPFFMGSADGDGDAFKPHDPRFDIAYGYAISQYAVTNAQFQQIHER